MTPIRRLQDIQLGNEELLNTYRNYFSNRYIDAAHNLINTNTLKSYVLQAEWMNALKTKIEDIEEPKETEIDNELSNKNIEFQYNINELLYLQEYDENTQYYKNNFVLYNNKVYFCIQNSLGNLPTNTSYWLDVGLIGEKGQYGLGVTYKGFWNNNTLYNKYDLVSYQNNLYIAVNNNSGNVPSQYEKYLNNNLYLNDGLYLGYTESNQYWFLLTRVQPQPIYISPLDYTQLPAYSIFLKELSYSIPSSPVSVSGSIISIKNALSSPVIDLTVGIEPVQDLHGYDNPWPAGGGANIFDGESESGRINTSTGEDSSVTPGVRCKNFIPVQPSTAYYVANSNNVYVIEYDENKEFIRYASYFTNRVYTTGNTAKYIRFYVIDGDLTTLSVNYPSTITTYQPYSNICPISGWTGCNVQRTGINIWNEEWEVGGIDNDTGLPDGTTQTWRSKNFTPVTPNTSYYLYKSTSYNIRYYWYDQNYGFLSSNYTSASTVLTAPSNAYYIKIRSTGSNSTYGNNISINYPSTDHDYHAYQGTTYPISWQTEAGTVYGGSLDVTTGLLTVDYQQFVVDGTNIGVSSKATTAGGLTYFLVRTPSKSFNTNTSTKKYYSNIFIMKASSRVGYAYAAASGTKMYIYLVDQTIDNTTDANEWFENNPAQFVIPLATPITYQLTPTEVTTLLGINNLWADTGDIELTYLANINS